MQISKKSTNYFSVRVSTRQRVSTIQRVSVMVNIRPTLKHIAPVTSTKLKRLLPLSIQRQKQPKPLSQLLSPRLSRRGPFLAPSPLRCKLPKLPAHYQDEKNE